MDYEKMKKEELITLLKENESLVEAGITLVHLPQAIEAKDKEISKLKTQLEEAIEAKGKELAAKYDKDYHTFKNIMDEENKKLKDALAESQKKLYDLDALRIKQLNELIYAHGDLLKTLQGVTDTHLKLNSYIVDTLSGGKE